MAVFIMPNATIDSPIESYAQSVDSIERLTAIDFFPQLNDDLERRLESTICTSPL